MMKANPATHPFFPEDRDLARLPREWIANVLNTFSPDAFKAHCAEMVKQRRERVEQKNNLNVKIRTDLLGKMQVTNLLDVDNGRGADLMRIGSTRRRTKKELEEAAQAEEQKEQQFKDMVVAMEKMQAENQRMGQKIIQMEEEREKAYRI